MEDAPDELERLLAEVRKTICDNRLFLEKLVDEVTEACSEDEPKAVPDEEDFEEL